MTFRKLLEEQGVEKLWYIISMKHGYPPIRAERLFRCYSETVAEMLALPETECKGTFVCKLYKDKLHGGAPEMIFDCSITYEGDPERYAFEFSDWADIVDCEVDEGSLREFGPLAVAAELLWEMTFCGYSRKQVQGEMDKLQEALDEAKDMESNGGKFIPAEDVFAEFNAMMEQRKASIEKREAEEWLAGAPDGAKKMMLDKLRYEFFGEDGEDLSEEELLAALIMRAEESTYKYKASDYTAGDLLYTMLKGFDYDEAAALTELMLRGR